MWDNRELCIYNFQVGYINKSKKKTLTKYIKLVSLPTFILPGFNIHIYDDEYFYMMMSYLPFETSTRLEIKY